MSRLLVITRPELLTGFALAGVEAFAAPDVETAVELIEGWLSSGEDALLAIDDSLLAGMDARTLHRLEAAEHLPFLAIPNGVGAAQAVFRRKRISELTRRAIGFHSVFKTEKSEENQS